MKPGRAGIGSGPDLGVLGSDLGVWEQLWGSGGHFFRRKSLFAKQGDYGQLVCVSGGRRPFLGKLPPKSPKKAFFGVPGGQFGVGSGGLGVGSGGVRGGPGAGLGPVWGLRGPVWAIWTSQNYTFVHSPGRCGEQGPKSRPTGQVPTYQIKKSAGGQQRSIGPFSGGSDLGVWGRIWGSGRVGSGGPGRVSLGQFGHFLGSGRVWASLAVWGQKTGKLALSAVWAQKTSFFPLF